MRSFLFLSSCTLLLLVNVSSGSERSERRRHRHRERNPFDERLPEEDLITKAITLPQERAKVIRNCPDCTKPPPGDDVCAASKQCMPLGTKCSDLREFSGRRVTTVSSHRCKTPMGNSGVSLFCCEKGSKEALNILSIRAKPHEYPHHVYVGVRAMDVDTKKSHNLNCGGTIIDKSWILTAAHCVRGPPSSPDGQPLKATQMIVLVGQNHIQWAEKGNKFEVDVNKSIAHPGFSYDPFINDIALLKLKTPLTFNGYVKPLAIAPAGFKEQGTAEVVGYGKTDITRSLQVLLSETATIQTNEKCTRITRIPKPETVMCIGGDDEAIPNQGDSGGGAICRDNDNNPYLCGIVSNVGEAAICDKNMRKPLNLREGEALPVGCGYPPAVFTRVSKFNSWIKEHMDEMDEMDEE